MNIADNYLVKSSLFNSIIQEKPNNNTNIIIVIPCYYEPDLIKSLNSLYNCTFTNKSVEIIVVINSSENESQTIINYNRNTFVEASEWAISNNSHNKKFHILNIENLKAKDAGVGLARKIGMDEALRRFNEINNKNGIIVGFDADCTCDNNYIIEIEKHFEKFPNTNACSIYFEHPISGNDFSEINYNGIIQYELYLRYYYQALKYIGVPYYYYTIGSSFAVNCITYAKQGGMNKKKAGEDFYFLQKIISLGNYAEINSTKVIPSPRPSDRVPFGTGASIQKWISNENEYYSTYNIESFIELKIFFENIDLLWKINPENFQVFETKIPESIFKFLKLNDFYKNLEEINSNSTSLESFRKRFYNWFNAFKVLKCLNLLSDFNKHCPISESALKLLKLMNVKVENKSDSTDILMVYRNLDKTNCHQPL
ncbi:MAG: hypothetical protein A2046_16505 [Bacteroidetes bacterium GWA2_30_7]|nr:MAG: hypothetical protein A2046_16505 [Bacteroidetes bacterium GWA2_30_7]